MGLKVLDLSLFNLLGKWLFIAINCNLNYVQRAPQIDLETIITMQVVQRQISIVVSLRQILQIQVFFVTIANLDSKNSYNLKFVLLGKEVSNF